MKGREYYTIFLTDFRYSNFDVDRLTYRQKGTTFYVDAFYLPSDELCPICESSNPYRFGYRLKTVKHCTNYTWLYIVTCHIQRYKCKKCGATFYEKDTFSNPKECLSKETVLAILERLKLPNETFESVASGLHLSKMEVIEIFDRYIDYRPPATLPEVLSFDEKSVNKKMADSRYLFVIVDFLNNKIYDILYSRHKNVISSYFSKIPIETRKKVKYITIDMWETYRIVAETYFKWAKIAIDSFHVVNLVQNALNRIRLGVMQKFNNGADNPENNHVFYYMLKKYQYILFANFDDLPEGRKYNRKLHSWMDKHQIRKYLLDIDERLEKGYWLFSRYLEFNKTASYETCREELEILIEDFFDSKLPTFIYVAKTLSNWKEYIINSFITIDVGDNRKRRLSNGPIEGINAQIQTIKSNGHGYLNFNRFRNRCVYVINKDVPRKVNK